MDRPRPSRVTTVRTFESRSVILENPRSTTNVADTEAAAASTGRLAATRPPNTNTSTSRVIGSENSSARLMSRCAAWLACRVSAGVEDVVRAYRLHVLRLVVVGQRVDHGTGRHRPHDDGGQPRRQYPPTPAETPAADPCHDAPSHRPPPAPSLAHDLPHHYRFIP